MISSKFTTSKLADRSIISWPALIELLGDLYQQDVTPLALYYYLPIHFVGARAKDRAQGTSQAPMDDVDSTKADMWRKCFNTSQEGEWVKDVDEFVLSLSSGKTERHQASRPKISDRT
jgi:hypothetical protein